MGAGKSLFCSYLAAQGAVLIDADSVAHQLLNSNSALKDALVSYFGIQILNDAGDINRSNLANIAFASPQAKAMLNEITHPYIRKVIAEKIDLLSHSTGPGQLLVLEGALLVETHAVDFYRLDSLVVIEAPDEVVLDRLRSTRTMTDSDISERLSAQIGKLARIKAADYVVFNSSGKRLLNCMAQNIYKEILFHYGK